MFRVNAGAAAAAIFLLVAIVSGAWAQGTPECASKLIPCQRYLNSTSPPAACCDPMREAVKTELSCLCSLFNNTDIFKAFQINLTQALELPKHCGITQGTNICKTENVPAPTARAPPGSTGAATDKNNAGRIASIGASTLTGLLLSWASMI